MFLSVLFQKIVSVLLQDIGIFRLPMLLYFLVQIIAIICDLPFCIFYLCFAKLVESQS